mgnify:CR=1 FL=1
MASGLFALNFYSPLFADQLRRGRKTAAIRLGDKSAKYERSQVVSGAAVTVSVQTRRGSGSWTSRGSLSGSTNASGAVTLTSSLYDSSGSSRVDEIRFRVTGVTKSGMTWQSNSATVTANRPN